MGVPAVMSEQQRQHQRWVEAQSRLVQQAVKAIPPGLARIRAERMMIEEQRRLSRDVLVVATPEPEPPPQPPVPVAEPAPTPIAANDDADDFDFDIITDPFRWKRVVTETARKWGVRPNEVMSNRRSKNFVSARHECFYRLVTETTMSLPNIGRIMGGFDHTTVLHGVRQHAKRIGDDRYTKTTACRPHRQTAEA